MIADQQDKWLREYLEPSLIVAKRLNPPRWFETGYFVVGVVVAILILIGGAVYYARLLPLLVAAVCSSGFLPYRAYKRTFQVERLIKGVQLSDVQANAQVTGLAAETSWVSEEGASAGFGFLTAGIGSFLGPLGAIVGGLVGSLFGWLIGESLQTRKQKLYESVLVSFNQAAPKMLEELERRLKVTEEAMLTTMKDNFSRNVQIILAALKE